MRGKGGLVFPSRPAGGQNGMVLLIVLVFLAVMTIGALAMMRATDSATLVAANLGYKQNGIASGDLAIEAAIAWLSKQSSGGLEADSTSDGYLASYDRNGPNIKAGQTWDAYWNDTASLPTGYKCWISWSGTPPAATCHSTPSAQTADAAGNKSAYLVQRLCLSAGAATDTASGCFQAVSASSSSNSSKGAGKLTLTASSQVYYRITVRVDGPRATVTYTQAVVAL